MGKNYRNDHDSEYEYQQWLKYRESSWEDRSEAVGPVEPLVNEATEGLFREYPEHQRMIEKAERDYLESKNTNK
ncbi:hypothetical protein FS595_09035 [Serratia rubidaea]|uniref:hypothetical protein n=1 Tax=Serratia rubidaea TaxID=61652 RepID=UPI001F409854|nr:hypothetical protein [Serratia rubidaea]UJD79834.1 hypothetical protein FS596_09035 [Serratia rubidaea]UJD84390.1 hypothetical protein FS595_09035 [Serratia rubidaea]